MKSMQTNNLRATLLARRAGFAVNKSSLSRHLRLSCRSDAHVNHNGTLVNGADSKITSWEPKSDIYLLRSDGYSCARETVTASGSIEFEHPTSQQQLLVWKQKPKRVMVLKKLGDELMPQFLDVIQYLGSEGMEVVVEPECFSTMSTNKTLQPWVKSFSDADVPKLHQFVDFIVCLGGDGLILHAAYLFGKYIPPIISFRLGSMGFLTCHDYEDYQVHLNEVINGAHELATCRLTNSMDGSALLGAHITLRMRLQCDIYRNGKPLPGAQHLVMNEVVLSRGAQPYLSKIEVYERDEMITKVQADGAMLATPTGSTAYSAAAGGSMVHPNVPAILFTPICPHSLSFRPIILPDYAEIELRISPDARSTALATFDGKAITELMPGDSVHVKLSPYPVPTINNRDQTVDWFGSVERCFSWNDRLEQKKLTDAQKAEAANKRSAAQPSAA